MPGRLALTLFVGLAVTTLFGLRWLLDSPEPSPSVALPLAALQSVAARFPEPDPETLRWPADHAAHPTQFAEVWLFAGLLETTGGERYGFQLALFRLGLEAEPPVRRSAWATSQLYRGHLIISSTSGLLHASERYSRAALGLSGSDPEPARVWLEDWQVVFDWPHAIRVQAGERDHGLALDLAPQISEPLPLAGPGYRGYWLPALRVDGELILPSGPVPVTGHALLDRLWGRSLPLGAGQLAQSRLWLALADGRAVRCSRLQRRSGGGTPLGECLVRERDGVVRRFDRRELDFAPRDDGWRVVGGVNYPLNWRLSLGTEPLEALITPLSVEQAPPFGIPLWSGIVQTTGGWGLLELSNFAEP